MRIRSLYPILQKLKQELGVSIWMMLCFSVPSYGQLERGSHYGAVFFLENTNPAYISLDTAWKVNLSYQVPWFQSATEGVPADFSYMQVSGQVSPSFFIGLSRKAYENKLMKHSEWVGQLSWLLWNGSRQGLSIGVQIMGFQKSISDSARIKDPITYIVPSFYGVDAGFGLSYYFREYVKLGVGLNDIGGFFQKESSFRPLLFDPSIDASVMTFLPSQRITVGAYGFFSFLVNQEKLYWKFGMKASIPLGLVLTGGVTKGGYHIGMGYSFNDKIRFHYIYAGTAESLFPYNSIHELGLSVRFSGSRDKKRINSKVEFGEEEFLEPKFGFFDDGSTSSNPPSDSGEESEKNSQRIAEQQETLKVQQRKIEAQEKAIDLLDQRLKALRKTVDDMAKRLYMPTKAEDVEVNSGMVEPATSGMHYLILGAFRSVENANRRRRELRLQFNINSNILKSPGRDNFYVYAYKSSDRGELVRLRETDPTIGSIREWLDSDPVWIYQEP